ncbi:hypothetical protein K426_21429 [Sphingobium sp. TKS]|nr:hypothetical protein K426_21429 [Sphingobium sp. TKS]
MQAVRAECRLALGQDAGLQMSQGFFLDWPKLLPLCPGFVPDWPGGALPLAGLEPDWPGVVPFWPGALPELPGGVEEEELPAPGVAEDAPVEEELPSAPDAPA